ncbi:MAG: S53 family peptidase [Ktedonobacteraceae bacterium]
MRKLNRPHLLVRTAVVVLALLTLVGGIVFSQHITTHAAAATIVPHAVHVHPISQPTTKAAANPNKLLFTCQLPNAPFRCYSPQQIATAYSFNSLYKAGITGKHSTIVIIDAFQSPTISSDLTLFDATFGLANPTLNIIAPLGLTSFNPNDPNQVGWSQEITLDVEWAHAIAPSATIDLVLAPSNMDADLLGVTEYAVNHHLGQVISQSFGEAESCVDPTLLAQEHQLFAQATRKGITLLASSGDSGAAQPTCDGSTYFLSASSPASDPYVTAVGGTQLFASASGAYKTEITWNESDLGTPTNIGSGGGFSTIYAKPSYQNNAVPGGRRGVPDVAYNAAVNGGVLVAYNGSFLLFGGTSAGSPQWAGVVALANQYQGHAIGYLNPIVYGIAKSSSYTKSFHDIIAGNNSFFFLDGSLSITGYSARTGWDPATGLGTPIASNLVPKL